MLDCLLNDRFFNESRFHWFAACKLFQNGDENMNALSCADGNACCFTALPLQLLALVFGSTVQQLSDAC